ncbi:MAG: diaminopropionate ammonia-lyase [Pusillimonas sp.]
MSNAESFNHFYVDAVARQQIDDAAFRMAVKVGMPQQLYDEALRTIPLWAGYEPTPLHDLAGLAGVIDVASVVCKDEGSRFGQGSFKALGGAYAVRTLAAKHEGPLTVACATEGNHGRSVAWGAQQAGARCVIFLHERVSAGREQAIAKYGAEIRRVPGNYDDAVLACTEMAEAEGWTVVSDTTWPGYEDIPKVVMAGYGVMLKEMLSQFKRLPTHVFLQAGVGGMAAAMMAAFHYLHEGTMPKFIIVEPRNAACIMASVRHAGILTTITGSLETVSAGLACGAPSPLALTIVNRGAHAVLAVDDDAIIQAMRMLAQPVASDPAIVAGASGAAGLAGLQAVRLNTELCKQLEIGPDSHVLLINTESDTDRDNYLALMDALSTT